jgi:hypothetical protein
MMASPPPLTQHDLSILDKIKDPESGPAPRLVIEESLPRDPHVTDPTQYDQVTARERAIISSIQALELQIAGWRPASSPVPVLSQYLDCVKSLDALIDEYPDYASARNNRAQALRMIYGDSMLVRTPGHEEALPDEPPVLDPTATDATLISASRTILTDLSTAITLLTPPTPFSPLSPLAARTLAQAHTQRGGLYHLTAKRLALAGSALRIDGSRREAAWCVVQFEENASRDFQMGGRFGNEVAKAMAVSANPTAKLCGEMVKEAMRKEYAGGGS